MRHAPSDHAGGKWRLTYEAASGRSGNLEVDVNFLHRAPLWSVTPTDSRGLAGYRATRVPLLDVHDLAAGKLAALLSRAASRDIFDAHHLLQRSDIDRSRLRLAFVVHGAMNRRDWREVSVDDVQLDAGEARSQLVPMLRAHVQPEAGEIDAWGRRLVTACREGLAIVLPLTAAEHEFLTRLNDDGRIEPELLTADPAQQARLRAHPGLLWKAVNVQRHRGRDGDGAN